MHWPYDLDRCVFCAHDAIRSFANADGRYRVLGCSHCRKYLKAYDAQGAPRPVLTCRGYDRDTAARRGGDSAGVRWVEEN